MRVIFILLYRGFCNISSCRDIIKKQTNKQNKTKQKYPPQMTISRYSSIIIRPCQDKPLQNPTLDSAEIVDTLMTTSVLSR